MESYIRLFFSDFAYTHPSPLALTCQPTCAVVYMLTYTYTQHNAPTALVSRLNDSLLCQKLSESHFVLCLLLQWTVGVRLLLDELTSRPVNNHQPLVLAI